MAETSYDMGQESAGVSARARNIALACRLRTRASERGCARGRLGGIRLRRNPQTFGGRAVRVDGPQGRFADTEVIDGRKLQRVMAAGKHLGYDFGKDRILHVHLGLQGDFTEGAGPLPEVRGALRLRMGIVALLSAVQ